MDQVEIIIRPYDSATDDPYIYSSWTRYAWYSPITPIATPKKEWFSAKASQIKHTLKHGYTRIACYQDDPNAIVGYVVTLLGKTQWLCVKKNYHLQGIEELLLNSVKEKLDGPETQDASLS